MKPVVGLTLNYRDTARTARCVQSLLDDGACAVLIWDNSDDGGVSHISLRRLWANENRVHIESSPCNLGFAAGVNRGIEVILKRYPEAWIMLINNDATVRKGALVRLVRALDCAHFAIAYPRINHAGRIIGTMHYQRHLALQRFDRPMSGSFCYPSGCAMLIAPERIGLPLLDEDFFMYGEDVMLGWRLGTERMAYVPEVLVDHEGNASSEVGSLFYETRIVVGHLLMARKLASHTADCLLLMMGRCMSLPARALLRSLRYRSAVPWRALWRGWRLAWGDDHDLLRAKKASTGFCQR